MPPANADLTISYVQHQEPRGRWQFLFSWTGVSFVGWVIYELTSEANLAVIVICCKLGWEDFLTAIWLRRRDPVKARGKMSFWIFTAWGLWKTAITAMIIMFMILFILVVAMVPNRQPQPDVPPVEFQQAGLMAMIGVVLSTLATCRSLGLAIWHKQKIWLDRSIHMARRHNQWPPPLSAGENMASFLMKVAIGFFSVAVILPASLFMIFAVEAAGIEFNAIGAVLVMIMLIALPTALFVVAAYLKRKFLASRSDECWPPGVEDFANTDKL